MLARRSSDRPTPPYRPTPLCRPTPPTGVRRDAAALPATRSGEKIMVPWVSPLAARRLKLVRPRSITAAKQSPKAPVSTENASTEPVASAEPTKVFAAEMARVSRRWRWMEADHNAKVEESHRDVISDNIS